MCQISVLSAEEMCEVDTDWPPDTSEQCDLSGDAESSRLPPTEEACMSCVSRCALLCLFRVSCGSLPCGVCVTYSVAVHVVLDCCASCVSWYAAVLVVCVVNSYFHAQSASIKIPLRL